MLIRPVRAIVLLAVGLILASPLLANNGTATRSPVLQQQPEFPVSELRRGNEGWVIVSYGIDDEGNVVDARVTDSSGRDAFEHAALDAVQGWKYAPGAPSATSAQVNFVFERRVAKVSKSFFRKLKHIHESVELGQLDEASAAIRIMRRKGTPSAFENAYLLIAAGRLAGASGDLEGQIEYFRKAALSEGRWLARSDYLKLLQGLTVLELQAGDYAAALRHYAELGRTGQGRKLAADLAGPMQTVDTMVAAQMSPETGLQAADQLVTVVREMKRGVQDPRMTGPGPDDGFRPSAPAAEPSATQSR